MSCERYEEGLIDHALGAPAAPEIQAHVASCAACRSRLEEERRLAATMDGLLTSTLEVAPSPGFDLAIKRRVSGTRSTYGVKTLAWIGGGLAAALLMTTVLWRLAAPGVTPVVTSRTQQPTPPPPPEGSAVPDATTAGASPEGRPLVRRTSTRRPAKRPALPDVIVPPDPLAALNRYVAGVQSGTDHVFAAADERPLPSAPARMETGGIRILDDFPRLSISEGRVAEPLPPLQRLVTGGES